MRLKVLVPLVVLLLAVAWLFWPRGGDAPLPAKSLAPAAVVASVAPAAPASSPAADASAPVIERSAASTNREAFRLSNTDKTIGDLTTAPHAILLENALVDTDAKLTLNIPQHLKASAEPGAFIVQARGAVTAEFRAALAAAGAQIVSYMPNNAYLVELSGAGAGLLSANPQVQAVLPYEPYFKVQSSLLGRAVEQKPLVPGTILTLGLFGGNADATIKQIQKLGGNVVGSDVSPFGPVVRVLPLSADWLALARLPGVMRVEPATQRQLANDLSRVTMAITTGYYSTNENWLNLTGSNVLVQVNDTGIDATQPDLVGRVLGYSANSLTDTNGHGTHIAGIIAGSGVSSPGVTAAGSVTNADYRGKAPLAKLYSFGIFGTETSVNITEAMMQAIPALTNALISNNSWSYGVNEYDLSAASFDAAVRDSLPTNTGPQPVLYVFPAGNDGGGRNDGYRGRSDSIVSPGTAKNVLTVGALEQYRYITNEVVFLDGTTNAVWQGETDSADKVAFFSGRGNVGVQTEGAFGRFKPDVVAPGAFVLSTLSPQMNLAEYYNPTNYHTEFSRRDLQVSPGGLVYGGAPVPNNAVGLTIRVQPNASSPKPFPPNFPIYFSATGVPGPTNSNDIVTSNNVLSIPPGGGTITSIAPLLGNGFAVAVGDPTNIAVNFDLVIQIATTNDAGNTLTVLSNINQTVSPNYMYRSGTSMASAAASGSLALLQEFLQSGRNPSLPTAPTPALLKAMLINGARLTTGYDSFAVTNFINYEGWGLVNVPNSLPAGLTNVSVGGPTTLFVLNQSPTNVLATGDSRTYNVQVSPEAAQSQILRITLAWTDPPGNPAAAIKLVNNLDLVVTNLDTGAIYCGNRFLPGEPPYTPFVLSNAVFDAVNNIENIWIPDPLGTNYSVTVIGRNVAVNAVTLNQTNIVQDYALVISCGDALNTNGVTVTPAVSPAPTAYMPQTTYISSYTNGIYFNQLAGANAPWLSTNNVAFASGSAYATNAAMFIGQTNQWHFFVVTNTTTYTNAAFIIFLPQTQSLPRMGVFEYTEENSTRPEADLNLFVASAPDASAGQLTNLSYSVISNCVFNVNGDQSSLSRGGTKFIVYSNSAPGQVYTVGVQCQDQMAAQFGFLSVFSLNPFSQLNPDGSQTVNGLLVPVAIPDGNNAKAGVGYCVGLALYPMEVGDVTVTNVITHENYGDLVEILSHGSTFSVLNNKNGENDGVINLATVYNDAGMPGTVHSSGPGSLDNFVTKEGSGPWILTAVDDAQTASGSIVNFTLNIKPNPDLEDGVVVTIGPKQWFYGYVQVDVGYTNLLLVATNLPPVSTPPIEMYLNFDKRPGFSNYLAKALLTNGVPWPGNSISQGPPLEPGTYWVGLYNPDFISHDVYVKVTLSSDPAAIARANWTSTNALPLVDDAVSYSSILVTNTDLIQDIRVGLRVEHERISDLVFTLISPDGGRYLLMENRGGQSTNGCGASIITTNIINVSANGDSLPQTNSINVGLFSGTFPITYNFYTAPDRMTVYYGTNVTSTNLVFDTGLTNNPSVGIGAQATEPRTVFVNFPPAGVPADSTYLTIVMNQDGNTNSFTAWTYTAGGLITNNYYLTFTEDTNLTTVPIKYAVPPLVPGILATNTVGTAITTAWQNSFEGAGSSTLVSAVTNFAGGWQVDSGSIDWILNGTVYIDLNGVDQGVISTNLPTVPGQGYALTFAYARNPDSILAGTVPEAVLAIGGTITNLTVAPAVTNDWTNLMWSVTNIAFTASGSNTLISFASLTAGTNGVLLDDVVLKTVGFVTNTYLFASDLYYLPEQSLDDLIRTSAAGEWKLEILDNRMGATNNARLLSWQLNFTYANTNLPATPPVITAPATSITFTSATLNALVYAAGDTNTVLYFRYGTTTNYELGFTASLLLTNNLNSQQALGIAVTNLPTPDTLYHFQAFSSNSTGIIYPGGDLTFFAHEGPPPYATTLPATLVTGPAAQLNGFASPNGLPSTAWFEWGTNVLYGNRTAPVSVGAGNTVVFTNAQISGLTPNLAYHYRLVVSNVLAVTSGYDQVLDQAYVVAWGAGYAGQVSVPLGLSNVVAVSAAYEHSLALKNNGQAVGWGNNNFGQATVPAGLNNLVGVAGGDGFSLALKVAGTVAAWGNNNLGQTNIPTGLSNVVSVAAGAFSSLALKADGQVSTWGFGFLNAPAGLSNLVAVAGGKFHSLALKADGTVTAWGDNGSGQLNIPAGLSNVVAIAAGNFHNLALKYDGTVVAWGGNSSGQTNVPAGLNGVAAIAAGGFHSVALRAGDGIVAWGDPSAGQTTIPTGLTNVVAISAGYLHNLALTPTLPNSTNPPVFDLIAGAALTNTIFGNSITYYRVDVPTNANFATNALLFAQNGLLNIWYSTNTPARIGVTNATLLLGGVTNGVSILSVSSNGLPALVPGLTYYLGVQNTNAASVFYAVSVNFNLVVTTNLPPVPPNNFSIVSSNGGFLLTWFAPSNELFQVQFTTNLAPANWISFTNIVGYNTNAFTSPTNTQFNFFDNGVLYPFGPTRFYRLILLTGAANTPPVFSLGSAATRFVTPTTLLTVTNTATDANAGQTLTYSLVSPPVGASIGTNTGVITWTPPLALAGTTNNTITSVVTDNGTPALSATNVITVWVNPLASISSVTLGTNGTTLQWTGWTNEQFNVQWATNLVAPVTWTPFPQIITSTNGAFTFVDTNTTLLMKFYQLILLP